MVFIFEGEVPLGSLDFSAFSFIIFPPFPLSYTVIGGRKVLTVHWEVE